MVLGVSASSPCRLHRHCSLLNPLLRSATRIKCLGHLPATHTQLFSSLLSFFALIFSLGVSLVRLLNHTQTHPRTDSANTQQSYSSSQDKTRSECRRRGLSPTPFRPSQAGCRPTPVLSRLHPRRPEHRAPRTFYQQPRHRCSDPHHLRPSAIPLAALLVASFQVVK